MLTYAGLLVPVALIDPAGNAQRRQVVQVLNQDGTPATVYSDASRAAYTGSVASDADGNVGGVYAEPGVYRLRFTISGTSYEVVTVASIDPREITDLHTLVTGTTSSVTAEAAARAAAVAAETSRATAAEAAEAALRATGDTNEANTRAAADSAATAAQAAATALEAADHAAEQTAIGNETSARAAAVTAEQSRATAAEAALSASLSSEIARATAAEGTKAQGLVPTALKTSAYTAAAADLVLVDTTSAAVTVTLPTAPADKTRIAVKHVVQGGSNVVTIAAGGTDRFNTATGPTSATLTLLNQAVQLQYVAGSPGRWIVSADDLPLSQLDLRFLTPAVANGTYSQLPKVYDKFSTKGTAALGAADSGQTWLKANNSTTGSGLSVIGGQVTNTATAASAAAGYMEIDLGSPVDSWAPDGNFSAAGSTNGGGLAFGAWKTSLTSVYPSIPDSNCHVTMTPDQLLIGTWSGGVFTQRGNWTFVDATGAVTPLAADDLTTMAPRVTRIGNTITIQLPALVKDVRAGTASRILTRTVSVTHAAFGTTPGTWAFFEVFQNNASTDHRPAFTAVNADASALRRSSTDAQADAARASVLSLAAAVPAPVGTVYSPGSSVQVNWPTAQTIVDATNLSVTFTFPPSGKVRWEFQGWVFMQSGTTAGCDGYVGLMEGASSRAQVYALRTDSTGGLVKVGGIVTGTPGATVAYSLSTMATVSTKITSVFDSASARPATLVVTPLAA